MAAELEQIGWDVITESDDGVRAVAMALEHPPLAVVISLEAAPNRARDVALALGDDPEGRRIPVLFTGGDERGRRKIRRAIADPMVISWSDLPESLGRLNSRTEE